MGATLVNLTIATVINLKDNFEFRGGKKMAEQESGQSLEWGKKMAE